MKREEIQAIGYRFADDIKDLQGLSLKEIQVSVKLVFSTAIQKLLQDYSFSENEILEILHVISETGLDVLEMREERLREERNAQEKAAQAAKDALDEARIKAELGEN